MSGKSPALRILLFCVVALFALGTYPASSQEDPSTLDDYIEQARATPTPTPIPAAGDPIVDGLFWLYVRVPAELGSEMVEDGCMVRDEVLDQSLYEHDPFVIADENGAILTEDEFLGTSRIRWEQLPWEPGTSDEGWTGPDGTRICRLQGRLPFLPYSPIYQVVVGERTRGPFGVTWESIVANDRRLILDVDLTNEGGEQVSTDAVYVPCPFNAAAAVSTGTTALVVRGENPYVEVSTLASPFGTTQVWFAPDERDAISIMIIPAAADEEIPEVNLYAELDARPGEGFRVELEAPPFALVCGMVVHGAAPA